MAPTFFCSGDLLVAEDDNKVEDLVTTKRQQDPPHAEMHTYSRQGYEINLFFPGKSTQTRHPIDCGLSWKNLVSESLSTSALGIRKR